MALSLVLFFYLVNVRPFNEDLLNNTEIFNELTILLLSY